MRKNSIRKFVHAVLDLLPLFVIPIFAIYTRNENYNSNIEITINESYYETNVKYETNEVNTLQDIQLNKIYHADRFLLSQYQAGFNINVYSLGGIDFESSDFEIDSVDEAILSSYNSNNNNVLTINIDYDYTFYFTNEDTYGALIFSGYMYLENIDFVVVGGHFDLENFEVYMTDVLNDEGYTISEYITSSDFKVLETIYHENTPVVYNDTDVGSQFIYTLYNATDKYFNMNNVFNMNDVYDWFVLNIFGGNAPLGLYIVWNIVLYEFVMDLLMLLYGVFMFFIDCCTKLIEKPLNAIK